MATEDSRAADRRPRSNPFDDSNEIQVGERWHHMRVKRRVIIAWDIILAPPATSIYAGQQFNVEVLIGGDGPPTFRFETAIGHPNVALDGNVTARTWTPAWEHKMHLADAIKQLIAWLETPDLGNAVSAEEVRSFDRAQNSPIREQNQAQSRYTLITPGPAPRAELSLAAPSGHPHTAASVNEHVTDSPLLAYVRCAEVDIARYHDNKRESNRERWWQRMKSGAIGAHSGHRKPSETPRLGLGAWGGF